MCFIKQEIDSNVKQGDKSIFDFVAEDVKKLSFQQAERFREYLTKYPSRLFNDNEEEIYRGFIEFAATEIENEGDEVCLQSLATDLFNYVPEVFQYEVRAIIEKKFKGDCLAFVKDREQFFNVFTIENLFHSNLTADGHYNKDFIKENLKFRKRTLWHAQVLLKLVGGYKQLGLPSYICRSLMNETKRRIKKNQEFFRSNVIVDEAGKIVTLAEVTRTTAHRVAENLNMIKTFERMAQPDKKQPKVFHWAFITLTLSPEKHPNPSLGKNSYDGTSPYDSARGMKNKWNRVRALLRKRGINPGNDYYGSLVSEAHKDGCQHLHALFFYRPGQLEAVKKVFCSVFQNINFDQNDKSCSFKLDNGKASASSYVFKYINKSTALYDPELDLSKPLKEEEKNAIAISAFRYYNSIRGVSFFGLENCLTKWRFLSRNINRIVMSQRLAEVIKTKDFYAFITEGHYAYIVNKYVCDEKKKIKRFVGCYVGQKLWLKNFFGRFGNKNIPSVVLGYLKKKAERTRLEIEQLVLVSHNCSSGRQRAGPEPPMTSKRA